MADMLTADRLTPEERTRRLAEGLTLQGRWYYKIREHIYVAGGAWDQSSGSYLMPDQTSHDEFVIPEKQVGDILSPCGRYAGWPVRCINSEYLAWLVGPSAAGVPWTARVIAEATAVLAARSEAEREMAREAADHKRRQDARKHLEKRAKEEREAAERRAEAEAEKEFVRQWTPRWESLTAADQIEIESAVEAKSPGVRGMPLAYRRACLGELARRCGG